MIQAMFVYDFILVFLFADFCVLAVHVWKEACTYPFTPSHPAAPSPPPPSRPCRYAVLPREAWPTEADKVADIEKDFLPDIGDR